jgi:hypothetical protein
MIGNFITWALKNRIIVLLIAAGVVVYCIVVVTRVYLLKSEFTFRKGANQTEGHVMNRKDEITNNFMH